MNKNLTFGLFMDFLALPQFFKSSGDEKGVTTQAGKFPKLWNAVMMEGYGETSLAAEIKPKKKLRTYEPERHQRYPL
jgi:hypothetical protein